MVSTYVLAFVFAAYLLLGHTSCDSCPSSWHRFEEKCILFNETKATFNENLEFCSQMNATMIFIHSEEENIFLTSLLSDNWHWLGAEQVAFNLPSYKWLDGSDFNYFNWSLNEPDCNQQSHCCRLIWSDGFWFDEPCSAYNRQLCQLEAATTPNKHRTVPLNSIDRIDRRQRQLSRDLGVVLTQLSQLAADAKHHNMTMNVPDLETEPTDFPPEEDTTDRSCPQIDTPILEEAIIRLESKLTAACVCLSLAIVFALAAIGLLTYKLRVTSKQLLHFKPILMDNYSN